MSSPSVAVPPVAVDRFPNATVSPVTIAHINGQFATDRYRFQRCVHWSLDEIDTFTTDEIFAWLKSFGIVLDADEFREQSEAFISAENLAGEWKHDYHIQVHGFDADFPWMAACVLWRRLLPERPSSEMISDWIDAGYDAYNNRDTTAACRAWLKCWNGMKRVFGEDYQSVEEIYEVVASWRMIGNWCQDFELELGNAGHQDCQWWHTRLEFCREFRELLPESDPADIKYLALAEAETLIFLGREEEGAALFQEVAGQSPEDPWPWIHWGDALLYRVESPSRNDVSRAEELFHKALHLGDEQDRRAVRERLRELCTPRARPDSNVIQPEKEDESDDEWSSPRPKTPILLRTATVGRNEPCPCGSGRKYKKCCGAAH